MVPLANGKASYKDDLVGEHRSRHQQKHRLTTAKANQKASDLIRKQHRLTPRTPSVVGHLVQRACETNASQFDFGPPISGTKATGIKLRTWRSRGPLLPLVTSMSV